MSSSSVAQEFRSQDMEPQPPFPQFVNGIVGSMARGKRSKRPRPYYSASEEDHVTWSSLSETEAEEEEEQQQLAAYSLMMIAHAHGISSASARLSFPTKRKSLSLEDFEADCPEIQVVKEESEKTYNCKTCTKKFLSFQALGGHRASCHNKTRLLQGHTGGFDFEHVSSSPAKERLHICPICDRVFTSGQALGGHKRTHTTPSTSISHTTVAPPRSSSISTKSEQQLDLNMPAPFESVDSPVAPPCSVTPLPPRFAKPNYKFNPYWWMESPARSTPALYDGSVLVATEDEARRDLGFKQDLFLVATVN